MSNSNTRQPEPALANLIRPAHILTLFRQLPERKTYYFQGTSKLWNQILTQPPSSPAHQKAYRALVELTRTIKEALAQQKEAEKEKKKREDMKEAARLSKANVQTLQAIMQQRQQMHGRQIPASANDAERAAFRTLVAHIATRDAIPSIAQFEAGLSAFQAGNNGGGSIVDGALSEQDAKLARDDVETALELLKVDVDEVSAEDIYAGLTLLDLKMSVRVEEYLKEAEKRGR